jgi:hypothetical protein
VTGYLDTYIRIPFVRPALVNLRRQEMLEDFKEFERTLAHIKVQKAF